MVSLVDINRYSEIHSQFEWPKLWELFDGNKDQLNLTHECLDRHRDKGIAVSVKYFDGSSEHYSFEELSDASGKVANWLEAQGIGKGDRVAIMLDPGFSYYAAMFGAIKRGAIAVPLFTLFGPDALALRLNDCNPKLLLTENDIQSIGKQFPDLKIVKPDSVFWQDVNQYPAQYKTTTSADDLAVFQYTSGTTRALPEAVKHSHRAVVTLMIAALYGVGIRPKDRYFCPSSPAWGHGLWHGTIGPLALGAHIGSYSGKFSAQRILEALEEFKIDNMAAAPTVYRMLKNSGLVENYAIKLKKLSFTGEPIDSPTATFLTEVFGVVPCSMYGSTEVGVILVNYPGAQGYEIRPGALGKPAPGWEVGIVDEQGRELPTGELGEIAVKRKGEWFFVKDRGRKDEDGYFFHAGRSDDVIISAGWTMSSIEIEDTLMKHSKVLEAAVIGVPDELRGQVVKAYVVAKEGGEEVKKDIQKYMKTQLSLHEYPRIIEFVAELPKTPAGKINRKVLKDKHKNDGST